MSSDNSRILANVSSTCERTDDAATINSNSFNGLAHPAEENDSNLLNDSNSDNTHFDFQGGVNSLLPSPDKKESPNKGTGFFHANRDIPKISKPEIGLRRVTFDPTQSDTYEREPCVKQKDLSTFVDEFLGSEDLLQALDDYTQSVGQTSIFLPELEVPEVRLNAGSASANSVGLSPRNLCPESTTSRTPNVKHGKGENLGFAKNVNWKAEIGNKRDVSASGVVKRSDKRKPRTYSQAVPSQHCHICSRRPTETSPHAVCGNLLRGRCRKTICTKCFHQFRWDLKAAREAPPGTWQCPHCRGECPQRAQCVIYNRTSDRRRLKMINHRKRKDSERNARNEKAMAVRSKTLPSEVRTKSPDSGTTGVHVPHASNAQDKKTTLPMSTGTSTRAVSGVMQMSKKKSTARQRKVPSKATHFSAVNAAENLGVEMEKPNKPYNVTMHDDVLQGPLTRRLLPYEQMTPLELTPHLSRPDGHMHVNENVNEKASRHNLATLDPAALVQEVPPEIETDMRSSCDAKNDMVNSSAEQDLGLGQNVTGSQDLLDISCVFPDIESPFGGKNDDDITGDLPLKLWDEHDVNLRDLGIENQALNTNLFEFDTLV